MSADRTVVFFGLRFEFEPAYLDVLDEEDGDSRVAAATKAQLDVYYANFGGRDEKHFLFVGRNLGALGVEDATECAFHQDELETIMADTGKKLDIAGLAGRPRLFVQWQQDL